MFLKSTSPSSLYKPVDCLSSLFDDKDTTGMLTSSKISAPSKLTMVTWKQLSVFFFLPRFIMKAHFQGSLSMFPPFLSLIDQHFPKSSKLHAVFNRNPVKVSYSCTQNMPSMIKYHNKNVINKDVTELKLYNCKVKFESPLNGQCQVTDIIYQCFLLSPGKLTK